jgi:hypothetical protein
LITLSALASTFGGIVRPILGALKRISNLISQAALLQPALHNLFSSPNDFPKAQLKWDEPALPQTYLPATKPTGCR